jgi:hypothetical protein
MIVPFGKSDIISHQPDIAVMVIKVVVTKRQASGK